LSRQCRRPATPPPSRRTPPPDVSAFPVVTHRPSRHGRSTPPSTDQRHKPPAVTSPVRRPSLRDIPVRYQPNAL
jgi:hypothetical protein